MTNQKKHKRQLKTKRTFLKNSRNTSRSLGSDIYENYELTHNSKWIQGKSLFKAQGTSQALQAWGVSPLGLGHNPENPLKFAHLIEVEN